MMSDVHAQITRIAAVKGKHLVLREVQESDAEFILKLRRDPRKGRFLSPVDDDVARQRAWIRQYLASSGQAYFLICDTRLRPLGTVRLYDAQGTSFSWGSWIVIDEAPRFTAIESALLVYSLAIEHWGFENCHFKVHRDNAGTLGFHAKFGARRVRESDDEVFMTIDRAAIRSSLKRYGRHLPQPPARVEVVCGAELHTDGGRRS